MKAQTNRYDASSTPAVENARLQFQRPTLTSGILVEIIVTVTPKALLSITAAATTTTGAKRRPEGLSQYLTKSSSEVTFVRAAAA